MNRQRYLRLEEEEKQRKGEERRRNYRPCKECDRDLNGDEAGRRAHSECFPKPGLWYDPKQFCSFTCKCGHDLRMQKMNVLLMNQGLDGNEIEQALEVAQGSMGRKKRRGWRSGPRRMPRVQGRARGAMDGMVGCAFCT